MASAAGPGTASRRSRSISPRGAFVRIARPPGRGPRKPDASAGVQSLRRLRLVIPAAWYSSGDRRGRSFRSLPLEPRMAVASGPALGRAFQAGVAAVLIPPGRVRQRPFAGRSRTSAADGKESYRGPFSSPFHRARAYRSGATDGTRVLLPRRNPFRRGFFISAGTSFLPTREPGRGMFPNYAPAGFGSWRGILMRLPRNRARTCQDGPR
jgi:hypothetical protein